MSNSVGPSPLQPIKHEQSPRTRETTPSPDSVLNLGKTLGRNQLNKKIENAKQKAKIISSAPADSGPVTNDMQTASTVTTGKRNKIMMGLKKARQTGGAPNTTPLPNTEVVKDNNSLLNKVDEFSEGFRVDEAKAAEYRNEMLNLEGDSPKM